MLECTASSRHASPETASSYGPLLSCIPDMRQSISEHKNTALAILARRLSCPASRTVGTLAKVSDWLLDVEADMQRKPGLSIP